MKGFIRILAAVLLGAIAAAPSLAALEKYKDWDKGPEFLYFATDDERTAWKKVATDAEAEAFIALFWARRDPDPRTPRNEFRERIETLVKVADENFGLRGRRGALTERGQTLIVIGPPKSITPKDVTPGTGFERSGGDLPVAAGRIIQYTFLYEDERIPAWYDQKKLEITVEVDQGRGTETLTNLSQFAALQKKAVQAALAHPELKEPPAHSTSEAVRTAQPAPGAAAPEAQKGPALSAPVRSALEEALSKTAPGPLTVLPIGYRNGSTRLMIQVEVPAGSIPAPGTTRLAVLVRDRQGQDAARLEEAAGLETWKSDLFTGRSMPVPPGDYGVAAALLDASGAVLASGSHSVVVAPVPSEFGASRLLVARADLEGGKKQADDPFVFSGRVFLAPPEARFSRKDGLSYALRVYNPMVDPAGRTVFLRRSLRVKPRSGASIEVPSGEERPTPVPELQDKGAVIVDVAGSILDENIGDFFKPGDYEIRITVTDQVSGKKLEASAPFTVLGPPKDAAPPPAR